MTFFSVLFGELIFFIYLCGVWENLFAISLLYCKCNGRGIVFLLGRYRVFFIQHTGRIQQMQQARSGEELTDQQYWLLDLDQYIDLNTIISIYPRFAVCGTIAVEVEQHTGRIQQMQQARSGDPVCKMKLQIIIYFFVY